MEARVNFVLSQISSLKDKLMYTVNDLVIVCATVVFTIWMVTADGRALLRSLFTIPVYLTVGLLVVLKSIGIKCLRSLGDFFWTLD